MDEQRDSHQPVLLHLHIPRTAGTALRKALQTSFTPEQCYRLSDGKKLVSEREENPDLFERIKFVSGHFSFGIHRFFDSSIYLVILREPLARVRSLFAYVSTTPTHKLHTYCQQSGSNLIQTFYREYLNLSPQFSDGQVRKLLPFDMDLPVKLERRHLEMAIETLHRPDVVVGAIDCLPETLTQLGNRMNMAFPLPDRVNQAKRLSIDDEDDELIIEHNQLDLELYEAASALFSQREDRAVA